MNRRIFAAILAIAISTPLTGKTNLRIAVASNFQQTLQELSSTFEAKHPDTRITLIPGSSGKLYAQITNGAAFDAFFSADSKRPAKLEESGIALSESRFTFAIGILAFWQPGSSPADFSRTETLAQASPKLAPFGLAAATAKKALNLPPHKTVTSSSVSQAFTFARSGAANSAFVSYSQLLQMQIDDNEYILIDPKLHTPISQQAIALTDTPALHKFLLFCQSDEGREIIAIAGYRLP